jgi:hypothetical protein
MTRIWQVLQQLGVGILLLLVLGLTACSSSDSDSSIGVVPPPTIAPPAADPNAVSVPLFIRPAGASNTLRLLGVPVNVAGRDTELLLDTGSSGIRILASAVGNSGLVRTNEPVDISFGDQTRFRGVLATAPFSIGGVTTEEPVGIQVVDEVICNSPSCSASADAFDGSGPFFGIIGVSVSNRTNTPEIFSPLTRLPGNFDSGYILRTAGGLDSSQGFFTVGLTPNNTAGFLFRDLDQIGFFPDGTPTWADTLSDVLYSLDTTGLSVQNAQSLTVFDTGTSDLRIDPVALAGQVLDFPGGGLDEYPAGTVLQVDPRAGFRYTVNVGSNPRAGLDRILVTNFAGQQILGKPFFFSLDTLFDVDQGRIGFRVP